MNLHTTYLCTKAYSSLMVGANVNLSKTSLENTTGPVTGGSFLRKN